MVYFFSTTYNGVEYVMYMGKDKMENEELLKYSWPEDAWFHVDDHSSAHVYLRLTPGMTLAKLPKELLADCCQLVKANSIEGSKLKKVKIVYTMWTNLKKTAGMAAGQVGYKDEKQVFHTEVEKDREIILRLKKTLSEKPTADFIAMREERDKKERIQQKKDKQKREEAEKAAIAKKKEEAEQRSYKGVMTEENMTSNEDMKGMTAEEFEEDFM